MSGSGGLGRRGRGRGDGFLLTSKKDFWGCICGRTKSGGCDVLDDASEAQVAQHSHGTRVGWVERCRRMRWGRRKQYVFRFYISMNDKIAMEIGKGA